MRVLHVTADLGSYGAERFVALLLGTLREPDIQLAALTIATSRNAPADLHVPVFDAARRGRYDVAFMGRMIGAMRRWQPDIVHTHTHHGKYWGRLAALAAGVPRIVHTEHNSEFGAPPPFRLLNRALLARTDAVVAFSETHRRRLAAEERIPAGRITVIPNGITLPDENDGDRRRARAALGVSDDDIVLLHVGRLAAVKNQRLALDALALLPPGVRAVFIGDGPDRAMLAALADERGLAGRVTFLGFRPDAATLTAGADIALVTSLNEAMPLAVIEAMAAGAPLVSTPWNGAREMLGDGRYGIVAGGYDPPAFAAAITAVLREPAAAGGRAARARAFARTEFDIATTARRHAALYRAISERTRAATSRITAARS